MLVDPRIYLVRKIQQRKRCKKYILAVIKGWLLGMITG